jgi:hypothetical protein
MSSGNQRNQIGQRSQRKQDQSGSTNKSAGEGLTVWERMEQDDIAAGRASPPRKKPVPRKPASVSTGCPDSSGCQLDGRLNALVAEFRRTDGTYPLWKVAFALARLLKARSAAERPDEFEPVADWFFTQVGIDPTDGWAELEGCWKSVLYPEGTGAWAGAVERAVNRPLRFVPPAGPKAGVVASLAYYLSEFKGGPFVFNGEKVACSLGMTVRTAYRLIDSLIDRGVIRWHDPEHSYMDGKARVAEFIGVVSPEESTHTEAADDAT